MFIFLGADRVRLVDSEPKIAILLEITPCWVSPAFVPADIAAPIGPKTLIAAILLQNVCLADGFWAGVHLVITQTILFERTPTPYIYILQIPGNSYALTLKHNRQ